MSWHIRLRTCKGAKTKVILIAGMQKHLFAHNIHSMKTVLAASWFSPSHPEHSLPVDVHTQGKRTHPPAPIKLTVRSSGTKEGKGKKKKNQARMPIISLPT